MAKFAQVTYGSHGDTQTYTYIVNDSVRAGAVVYPTVTHYRSKKDFTTMGIVQTTNKMYKRGKQIVTETGIEYEQLATKEGEKIVQELRDKNADINLSQVSGEEDNRNLVSGIKEIKTANDLGIYNIQEGKTDRDTAGRTTGAGGTKMPTKATERTEGGNRAITTDPNQHYEPKQTKHGKQMYEAQLKNQTIYGFETIYPKK